MSKNKILKKVKFSVIIPIYNRSFELNNLLKSFQYQILKEFEVIIIDDGSEEDILSVINNFSDLNINYFRIKNSERGKARNIGFLKSSGMYLNFFDSDDIALKNHYQEALRIIYEQKYPDIFHFSYQVKNFKNNKISKKIFRNQNINKDIFNHNMLSLNSVFIKREIFEKNQFSNNRSISGTEDWELWIRLLKKYNIYSSSIITSQINNNLERSVSKNNFFELEKRVKILINIFKNKKNHSLTNNELNRIKSELYMYLALFSSTDISRNKLDTLKLMLYSIKLYNFKIFTLRFFAIIKKLILK